MRRRHRGRWRFRGLQARLLAWFLAAIILAIGASVVTTFLTNTDAGETPSRIVSRHVQVEVARRWDDARATDAYVDELRQTTGLDLRVRRDASLLATRRGRFGGGMVFEEGVAYIPIVKNGTPVGALELRTGSPAPRLWRVIVALGAALLVLGIVARRVSKHLSRPLEHLAHTAERFGSGDLAARTGVERLPRRWVADEVRDVGRAFDNMADRIQRVVVDQRELLAAISHELRSPLARARIALQIASERGTDSVAEPISDVDRQLVEVDAILGDLLASARAGLADLRLEEKEIVAFVRARIAAETRGLIELSAPEGGGPFAAIDPALLGRALHNVFANAWTHGHDEKTPLEVEVTYDAALVRIKVRDRGPGFPEALLPRAFEPFVSGGDASRSPGAHGVGLGLSLVRRIVEAHGGTAAAKNLEAGAEVTIELPLGKRSDGHAFADRPARSVRSSS